MPSCHVIYLFIYSFGEQSVLFGWKQAVLEYCFTSLKRKVGFLSAQHTGSLSAFLSPLASRSACFLLLERLGGGHSWQLPKMDPKWCTSAHIVIWHTAGAGGGRHFGFVSSSAQLGSCQTAEVAQVPGGWDAIGEAVLVWKSKDVRPQDHFSPHAASQFTNRVAIQCYVLNTHSRLLCPKFYVSFSICSPPVYLHFPAFTYQQVC